MGPRCEYKDLEGSYLRKFKYVFCTIFLFKYNYILFFFHKNNKQIQLLVFLYLIYSDPSTSYAWACKYRKWCNSCAYYGHSPMYTLCHSNTSSEKEKSLRSAACRQRCRSSWQSMHGASRTSTIRISSSSYDINEWRLETIKK